MLEVKNLRTYFALDEGTLKAVDGVSFTIHKNRTLGIVGESGCGKSVTVHSILGIVPKPGHVEGEILFHHDGQVTDLRRCRPMAGRFAKARARRSP
ncbi:MAG: ATP-binding cassette domain-containing protein [Caldilineaceae bacterium]